jgi:type I restriction enzyme M protein
MPSNTELLSFLSRDELASLAQRTNASVPARARIADLRDALVPTAPRALRSAIRDLPRDRLKELCRKLGLDDGGRDKATIVGRLMASPKRRRLESTQLALPSVNQSRTAVQRPKRRADARR